MPPVAKRVTITRGEDGLWRMKVQSTAWRVMFASEAGVEDRQRLQRLAKRKYPGVEVVIVE